MPKNLRVKNRHATAACPPMNEIFDLSKHALLLNRGIFIM